MQNVNFARNRLLRLTLWALSMLAATHMTSIYAPHKTLLVPSLFLCMIGPAVLFPLEPKKKE